MFRVTAILLCLTSLVTAQEKPVWLVVGRPGLVDALAPLVEKRVQDGFETVVSTDSVEKALTALDRRPAYLVLIGDDQAGQETQSWYLPAKRQKQYRWDRTRAREFATDAAYGDLDHDGIPDIPVGRIPARTKEQVAIVVTKILAYEKRAPTPDDLRLPVWAGSPQYGAFIDGMATHMLLVALRQNAPTWCTRWIVTGQPGHPLCGWPPDQPALFTQQIQRGGALIALMGHASTRVFDSMMHQGKRIAYSASHACRDLTSGRPAAPMVVFACHSGNFSHENPCLAESFLFLPGGPVATVAATTESHPLTNFYSGISILKHLNGRHERLGDFWLSSQRWAMKARNPLAERLLRDVEGTPDEPIDVKRLKRDQILMYAILGDPATRLKLPKPLEMTVEHVDGVWNWKAKRPQGARRLEVGYRSAGSVLPKGENPGQQTEARRLFKEANATFEFTRLASLTSARAWSGTVRKEGWLRLVAVGPTTLHVAVVKLALPADDTP